MTGQATGPSGATGSAAPPMPRVRQITPGDILQAVARGWRDFCAAPGFGLAIAGLFVLGGLVILAQLTVSEQSWMILPIAVGFPLIGPFAAVGLYEVSHLLEQGRRPRWRDVFGRILAQRNGQIPSIAFVVIFFFGIWFYLAHLIFALFFGLSAMTNISSSWELLLSARGLTMLAVGGAVGGALALLLFSISVVSFPLLMDREVDFVTGMIVSVQAVLRNPVPMLGYALLVGVLSVAALVPLFAGLFVVLPVLGHATWHLYRRVVEPLPEAREAAEDAGDATPAARRDEAAPA